MAINSLMFLSEMWVLLFTSIIVMISAYLVVLTQSTTCDDAYSCYGQNTSIAETDTDIECGGYFSCAETTQIVAVDSGFIFCYGSYSCFHSQLIHLISTIDSSRHIYCMY